MKNILVCFIVAVCFCACQKKELQINFVEEACVELKINSPLYTWIKDPSCGGNSDSAVVMISFDHPNQKKCIDAIFPDPIFFNKNQQPIKNILFARSLKNNDSGVMVGESNASFIFRAKFASVQDANSLNNIFFRFHTENQLGDTSKTTSVRINGHCAVVIPSSYRVKDTVVVYRDVVQIKFFDDKSEDQDIISVYLNGTWVLENHSLTNVGNTFSFRVNRGYNDLVIFAVNQGKVDPNTCAIRVENGNPIEMKQNLNTGDAIKIRF